MSTLPTPTFDSPTIRCSTVTEIRFSNRMSLDAVRQYLRGLRVTGEIKITVSEGGINDIVFEERKYQRKTT